MSFAVRPNWSVGRDVNPLPGGAAEDEEIDPVNALATIAVKRDGTIVGSGNVFNFTHNWFTPSGGSPGDARWVRFTVVTGSISSGTAGTWLALTSDQTVGRNRTTIGSSAATVTIEIASDAAGTNIVAASASGAYSMTAIVSP